MDSQHPLLQRAKKYPRHEVNLAPPGCTYDATVGAWRHIESDQLWVDTPHRDGPKTKKQDIETGEDQKGE